MPIHARPAVGLSVDATPGATAAAVSLSWPFYGAVERL